ncbi:MAG: hypothetical protein IIW63_00200, partial [Clostridia bacterium]|nr:hypothetical protein [Clostridia bacterium]
RVDDIQCFALMIYTPYGVIFGELQFCPTSTKRKVPLMRRFFVNDYEDGKISFYCENFDILEN